MSFCSGCGNEEDEKSKFCSACGKALKSKKEPVEPESNSSTSSELGWNDDFEMKHWLVTIVVAVFVLFVSCAPNKVKSVLSSKNTVSVIQPKLLQPYKYIGKSSSDVGTLFSIKPNSVGNVIYDDGKHHVLFEATNNVVGFVDVGFIETAPCKQTGGVIATPLLQALGINYNSLNIEAVKKMPHSSTYYDHTNKLKIVAMCLFEGDALTVSFSRKYYMK